MAAEDYLMGDEPPEAWENNDMPDATMTFKVQAVGRAFPINGGPLRGQSKTGLKNGDTWVNVLGDLTTQKDRLLNNEITVSVAEPNDNPKWVVWQLDTNPTELQPQPKPAGGGYRGGGGGRPAPVVHSWDGLTSVIAGGNLLASELFPDEKNESWDRAGVRERFIVTLIMAYNDNKLSPPGAPAPAQAAAAAPGNGAPPLTDDDAPPDGIPF